MDLVPVGQQRQPDRVQEACGPLPGPAADLEPVTVGEHDHRVAVWDPVALDPRDRIKTDRFGPATAPFPSQTSVVKDEMRKV